MGILVVGIGTSLPELAVSIQALRNKAVSLSMGNLVGSNIFDALVTIGVGASIATLNVSKSLLYFDMPFLLATSALVVFLFRSDRKLKKWESALLVGVFITYAILKLFGM